MKPSQLSRSNFLKNRSSQSQVHDGSFREPRPVLGREAPCTQNATLVGDQD